MPASNSAEQATTPELRPVAELSFEQARDELALVVQQLEQGSLPLETALRLWERGEELAARCEEWLKGARERLERVRAEHRADSEADA
ncbi:exodeoxyribonuclease VII small subunit [Gulosibacter macacae]|nr:exodeoxyribonuclease VII small subunit [Gulosibacter macacae]